MSVEAYGALATRVLAGPPRLGRTRLVAVDGPSGAGKSVFAERLATAIGEASGAPAPIVHTDDLLDGWADQITFWPRLDERVLVPLRHGKQARYQPYDWGVGAFRDEWLTVPPAPVVILDGVTSARKAIRPELTLAVFVDAPRAVRRARTVARDGVSVEPSLDEWQRGEDRHFLLDGTAGSADLVVDGAPDLLHDPDTQFIGRWTHGRERPPRARSA